MLTSCSTRGVILPHHVPTGNNINCGSHYIYCHYINTCFIKQSVIFWHVFVFFSNSLMITLNVWAHRMQATTPSCDLALSEKDPHLHNITSSLSHSRCVGLCVLRRKLCWDCYLLHPTLSMEIEKLIEEIQKYKYMYDHRYQEYKKVVKKWNTWTYRIIYLWCFIIFFLFKIIFDYL